MVPTSSLVILCALILVTAVVALPFASLRTRQADRFRWAPFDTSSIHPGVTTWTTGSCTSNFVYFQGNVLYLGQAAHCASLGGSGSSNGCRTPTLPEGSAVNVTGATRPGRMVYSSWVRMQAHRETDANACAYNDLALVRLDPQDYGRVNPSLPRFGGPTGVRAGGLAPGERVYSYGSSILRDGLTFLSPKFGSVLREQGGGWSHLVRTFTPGIPGDSGSGFLDAEGLAFGVLSTLQLAPQFASNGVGDMGRELAYLRSFDEFRKVELALGTEAFRTSLEGGGKGGTTTAAAE
ncbi:hypothetical protein ACQY0O_000135 [Thecaphora frezii]